MDNLTQLVGTIDEQAGAELWWSEMILDIGKEQWSSYVEKWYFDYEWLKMWYEVDEDWNKMEDFLESNGFDNSGDLYRDFQNVNRKK